MKTRTLTLSTTALAAALVAGLALSTPAEARGFGDCAGGAKGGQGYQQMDPETQAKFQDMRTQRDEMRERHQAEIKALLERMPQDLKDDYNEMMTRHQAERDQQRQQMMEARQGLRGARDRGLPDQLN